MRTNRLSGKWKWNQFWTHWSWTELFSTKKFLTSCRWYQWIHLNGSFPAFKLPGAIDTAKRLEANFVKAKPKLPRFRSFFQIPASREVHDVIVIMDGSGSVSSCEFDKAKKALRYLLTMKNKYVDLKYAAITFSDSASVNFNFLPEYFAADQMNRITRPGGGDRKSVV